MSNQFNNSIKILLTGATGYIGGRLLNRLEDQGRTVRCIARRPEFLQERVASTTELVYGDVLDEKSLLEALDGVHTAYYLVHSMGSRKDFEVNDRVGAKNFANACKENGVKRIIYLGGLGKSGEVQSPHLRSRHEVGRILRESGIPTLEFRASIVLGSGSLSFELIRSLVDRLPVMITPRWVSITAQPIFIDDLLHYLLEALDIDLPESQIIEIGGANQVSYGELMREYGRQVGLRRMMIPVPVLTPYLSSLWLGLVTPVYARVGRKLIDSIRHPTIVEDDSAKQLFHFHPRDYKQAIQDALEEENQSFFNRWSDALSSGNTYQKWGGVKFGRRLVDTRTVTLERSPEQAFAPIHRIGGNNGWYYGNFLWRLRAWLDLLIGGVGMRRGRLHPDRIRVGDAVDFWRVEEYRPNSYVRFLAEMKVPGRAWLEFEVKPTDTGSQIRQTAIFDPIGLLGPMYWYALYPIHEFVFAGMLKGIAKAAEKEN